jgi:predicted Zn finger-like uncharacterized protein
MLIVCPSCSTAYRIELSTLGAAGRTVRCVRCRATWFASVTELASTALALPPGQAEPSLSATGGAREADREEPAPGEIPDSAADGTSITLANAPPLVPATAQENGSGVATGPDIESVAARQERRATGRAKRRRRPWPGLPTIILVLAAGLAALVNWRGTVVRVAPQTAGLFSAIGLPVNLRGLSLDDVKTSVETQEGVTVVVVEGTIANLTRQPLELPRLRFAVRNAAGYEVYAWTALPGQPIVAPGDRAPFRSRLASPPADAQDIIVRFFSRRDVAAAGN